MEIARKERIALAIALAPAVMGIVLACRPNPPTYAADVPPFDPIIWRNHIALNDDTLTEQADRLLVHSTLQGMTRTEVIDLLGEPNGWAEAEFIVYRLGPYATLCGVDSEWMTVRFGPDGRVIGCNKWHD